MDIDRFIARNQASWERLAELTRHARRSVRALRADELDELIALYQRASTHLSHARAAYGDAALTARLTALVASANGVIYGRSSGSSRVIIQFFTDTFPGAVYESRRFIAASAALLFVPAIAIGVWLANSDRVLDIRFPEVQREALLESEFEDYYSSAPAAEFSTAVLVNNIRVAITSFALGALLCVGTAFILVINGAHLGEAMGLFLSEDQAGKFFGLILPHGLLELTAITIAAAAGLRIGWAIIAPGDRPRAAALASAGRRAVTVILGLAVAFVVAGVIEGFVTPSGLPTFVRVGIGALVEVAFLLYVWTYGRAAVRAADDEGQSRPVALTLR